MSVTGKRNLLEGDRGQIGRDCIRTKKRGGGSPIVLPMSTTGNGKESVDGLDLHELGQSRVSVFQERLQ